MITGHVPAVCVPPDHAASSRPAAVPPRGSVEERRDLDPSPPGHRPATPSAVPPEADLGGPSPARNPGQRDTESAPSRAAGCWSLQTRSCVGTATSSAAARSSSRARCSQARRGRCRLVATALGHARQSRNEAVHGCPGRPDGADREPVRCGDAGGSARRAHQPVPVPRVLLNWPRGDSRPGHSRQSTVWCAFRDTHIPGTRDAVQ
jgi:hypothetical protein